MRKLLLASIALSIFCCTGGNQQSGRRVTAEQFGDRWPLTVEEGYVDCEPVSRAIFRANGQTYALNGMAMQAYPEIDPIWKDNPELEGIKMNIGPLTDAALELCE